MAHENYFRSVNLQRVWKYGKNPKKHDSRCMKQYFAYLSHTKISSNRLEPNHVFHMQFSDEILREIKAVIHDSSISKKIPWQQ